MNKFRLVPEELIKVKAHKIWSGKNASLKKERELLKAIGSKGGGI